MGIGIPEVASCKCLKTCGDYTEEVDLAKGDYLRSRTGNFKINIEPKNLAPFQQTNNNEINSVDQKAEIKSTEKKDNSSNEIIEKNSLQKIDEEEEEENKQIKTDVIKTTNTINNENKDENIKIEKKNNNNDNNISNSISKKNSSSFKYLKDVDYSIFFTEKLKKAEKNFDRPINYEKDWAQYCEDDDKKDDILILIETMNSNKGENHTKEEGQVIEQKGERFLYIGEIDKNQKPSGFGVLYTSHEEKYEGNFNKGKLIGIGRYINKDGTCYEGIFKNNKLVSKAKIIKNNENGQKVIYFGETINFKKNGKGEETCEGEYRYVGDFENDLKNGNGRLEYLDYGEIYEGEFKNGEFYGKGLFIWSNNEQYNGDFVKGVMHGKGKYKWPDGFEYEGDYNNGIKEGMGTYKYKDGRVFKGRFKDGKPDGKGKVTFKGMTLNIEYKNGKPVEDFKKLLYSYYSKDASSK